MRVYSVKTNEKSLEAKFNIVTTKPTEVRIIGYDPKKPLVKYFDITKGSREKPISGEQSVSIKMPITPKVLHVKVLDKNSPKSKDVSVKGKKFLLYDLHTRGLTTPYDESFMRLAKKIAQKIQYLPAKAYGQNNDPFDHLIVVSETIKDRKTGEFLPTPARVSTGTGVVELSKRHLREYSVPMIMYIICHEWAHHTLLTANEFVADAKGVEYYTNQGFPEIEAVYAFTRVFDDQYVNSEKERRAESVLRRLKLR